MTCFFYYQNETLILENVTKTDRGLYRCVADNQVRPPDEYLVAVNVFFKPDTIAVQDSVGQAADRQFDAKLECRVSGIYRTAHAWPPIHLLHHIKSILCYEEEGPVPYE